MKQTQDEKNRALTTAERWFAEKGIDWQVTILSVISQRAQAVLGIAGIVIPILLGTGSLSALGKLTDGDVVWKGIIVLVGLIALGSAVFAFVSAANILTPRGAISFPTPDRFVEEMWPHIDETSAKEATDRAVSHILRDFRDKNMPEIKKMHSKLILAVRALGIAILFSTLFVVVIAGILVTRIESSNNERRSGATEQSRTNQHEPEQRRWRRHR